MHVEQHDLKVLFFTVVLYVGIGLSKKVSEMTLHRALLWF